MTASPSALGAICYEAETDWGEDVTTFATARLPLTIPVDASGLKQDKIEPGRTVQRLNEGTVPIDGVMGGSFVTEIYLTGHGTSTSGATSVGLMEQLLGYVLGSSSSNATASASSGDTLTGGTAAVPATTAASGFTAGSLCAIGALGDGAGEGQFYAVGSHSSNDLTLLNELTGAPSNADVLYSAVTIYTAETSSVIKSLRFLLQSKGLSYECHGCYPTAIAFSGLNPSQVPKARITWGVSWWRLSTATFPSTATTELFQPTPTAAGSLDVQVVGTTTRNARSYRSFQLDYTLGIQPITGPGGLNQYQSIVDAVRLSDKIKLTWMEDADAATTTPVLDGYFTGTDKYHVCLTLNPIAGKAVGFFFPQVCITGARPVQRIDNNVNRIQIEATAYVGPTTTTDLTRSAMRMAFA